MDSLVFQFEQYLDSLWTDKDTKSSMYRMAIICQGAIVQCGNFVLDEYSTQTLNLSSRKDIPQAAETLVVT